MSEREGSARRETRETNVSVDVNLRGSGESAIATGVGFLDHLLEQLARHSGIDLTIKGSGDLHVDAHHTVEDVALTLGQALNEALGDRSGIARFGDATVPMDEALATVAVDLGGRPYAALELGFAG
ncbi:MAG TPA: imidazoleglycerol-phosphate dehydratase, partial [Dehalococcoidia bacterium]|nr:imidazoleglycerol-phosphate dehydratase [Dehalococcoidia bacterium]